MYFLRPLGLWDWFKVVVLTTDAASSKGSWDWEPALMWPIRFLGQRLSQPCMACCLSQICGTWSLSLWHSGRYAGRPGQGSWLFRSEFTFDINFGRLHGMWIKGWMLCRGPEQWLAFLYSVHRCPLLPGKGAGDTGSLYPRLPWSPRLTLSRLSLLPSLV